MELIPIFGILFVDTKAHMLLYRNFKVVALKNKTTDFKDVGEWNLCLKVMNSDWGIETFGIPIARRMVRCLKVMNSDWGIETAICRRKRKPFLA